MVERDKCFVDFVFTVQFSKYIEEQGRCGK